MEAATARHLAAVPDLIDPETGEISAEAPDYPDALSLLGQLEIQIRKLEDDLRGKRLQIAKLQTDRDQAALDLPERPETEVVWKCWKAGTKRRRPLHAKDREDIAAAVKKFGLSYCLTTLAGLIFDPYTKPLKNGKTLKYNDLETAFKTYGRVAEYHEKAPAEWSPDAEKIAAIAGVPIEWLRQKLGEAEPDRRVA